MRILHRYRFQVQLQRRDAHLRSGSREAACGVLQLVSATWTKLDTWSALRFLLNVCPPNTPCFGSILSQPRKQLSCFCSEPEYQFANIKFNMLMGLQETTRIYTSLKDPTPNFSFNACAVMFTIWTSRRVSHGSGEGQETYFESLGKNTSRWRAGTHFSALRFHEGYQNRVPSTPGRLSLPSSWVTVFSTPIPPPGPQKACRVTNIRGVGVVRALNLPPLANCALRGTRHTRLAQAVAAARARALRGPAAAPRHSIPHVALEAPQVPHLRGLRGVGGGAVGPARAGGPGLGERSPGAPSGPALTPPLASRGSARPPRVLAAANTRAPNSTCPESPGHFPFRSAAAADGPKLPRTSGASCARRGAQEPQPAPCSTRLPARRSRTRGWRRRAARCWWRRVAPSEHSRPRLGKGGGTRRGAPEVAAVAERLDR